MIVCHCQRITERDIHAAIDWMRRADEGAIITPGKIYRALGKAADCGSCMPLFLSTMRTNANLEIPMQARELRIPLLRDRRPQEDQNEGRRESHRVP